MFITKKLEPIQISLPVNKTPLSTFITKICPLTPNDVVIYLSPKWVGHEPIVYNHNTFVVMVEPSTDKVYLDDGLANIVLIDNAFNICDMRKIKQEAFRLCAKDGHIISWGPVCDDHREVVEFLEPQGVKVDSFCEYRLTNGDIIALKPNRAYFNKDVKRLRDKTTFINYCSELGFDLDMDYYRGVKTPFVTNLLDAVFLWEKNV